MRYVCLDTETSGLRPTHGARIIEIGMVEILDGVITGHEYQSYLKFDGKLDDVVKRVTQITDEDLIDKPSFIDISDKIINFLKFDSSGKEDKAIIVAHNAKFDLSFLNFHFTEINSDGLGDFSIIDTMDIVRRKFPGIKLTLDNICEKLSIDLSHRKSMGHGALLDSKILAEAFLKLIVDFDIDSVLHDANKIYHLHKRNSILEPRVFNYLSPEIQSAHNAMLEKMKLLKW